MAKKDVWDFALDIQRKIHKHDVVLAYAGEIDMKAINTLIDKVDKKISSLDEDVRTRKKVYHMTVECLENLFRHTDKPSEGGAPIDGQTFAVFSLMREDRNYYLSTGNYIRNGDIESLKKAIDKINLMNLEEKKQLYRDILQNKTFSEKGGAGLGIIEIAIRASGELHYEFKPIDENRSFYIFQTKVLN